jgi:TolB-like protein/AraC-like DNA-binding protein/Tfp pilus assembly protein PilF
MTDLRTIENDFIRKITAIVEENLGNEQFGVSDLAHEVGMSRSNLLRKVKKLTNLSVSRFIRQARLEKAMKLLQNGHLTVSEISYEVGFNSSSYFIKCFHDHYGYSPGYAGKNKPVPEDEEPTKGSPKSRIFSVRIISVSMVVLIILSAIALMLFLAPERQLEKSIAVLPFKNESNDSTNVYLVNGLMEAILNNLQKIEDLRVVSRTSVEKYRNTNKSIPEIAKELNVNYFIEGSGQKIGDQILLNIQLIESQIDKHLWTEQYSRETKDIFQLQMEVAQNIAGHIEAIITPEEQKRIEKPLTDNLVAYDYYMKALEPFNAGTREGLEAAIPLFKKAVEHDTEFAQAYAYLAIAYYFLDIYQLEQKHSSLINNYADKALFYDDKLSAAFLAKAFFYIRSNENKLAEPYLHKALEYNPNSSFVINTLSDFYDSRIPNTRKYLEYALKGIQIDIAANDSTTISYIYLHLANAFIQSGFVEQAEKYINVSIQYDPENLFSAYVKPYILYAKNKNLEELKNQLIKVFKRNITRIDIIQETGKAHYLLRDYESAYQYYQRFLNIKDDLNLSVYPFENAKIALVYEKMGEKGKAGQLMNDYFSDAQNDKSIYKDLSLAAYYSYQNNTKKALEHLEAFSKQTNFHYWTILFLDKDPLMDNIKDLPEFKKLFIQMKKTFWRSHQQIKRSLKEKELI